MLILSRRKEESIVIGESIELRVIEIRGDRVILGLEAPKEVAIRRAELPPREKDKEVVCDS